ncbi:MAG: hypothetical protein K8U03_19330 [Planctomycetia bacterium]|nr:hypothetical protein [Planctomycetia bacterium]
MAISNGRIPWPLGRIRGNSNRALIVYGALARAVRREANQAICFWWGVTAQTVSKWRKALGVFEQTKGDRAVRAEHGRRNWTKVGPKLLAKSQHPERRAKISAARTGNPRPKHVIEAMMLANTGRPLTASTKLKMSAAHKKRGSRPPWIGPAWTAEEDALHAKLPAGAIAKQTGRTTAAVYLRRRVLKRAASNNGKPYGMHAPTIDEMHADLHRSGWSVGEIAYDQGGRLIRQVDVRRDETWILAREHTQTGAWRGEALRATRTRPDARHDTNLPRP